MLFADTPLLSLGSALSLLSFVPFLPGAVVDYVQSFSLDAFERSTLERSQVFRQQGTGYQKIQGSRPGTIGQALFDNPVGILAWIGEKFHEWSDPKAPAGPSRVTPTHILNQVGPFCRVCPLGPRRPLTSCLRRASKVALYHLTGTIHTSCLPYKDFESKAGCGYLTTLPKSTPVGYSAFPYEI